MKSKLLVIFVLTTFMVNNSYSLSIIDKMKKKETIVLNSTIDLEENKYHILIPERSPKGGTTKTLLLNEGENKGVKILVIRACENGCVPAIYTYKEELSSTLGLKVFFNSAGLYVIQYDGNSFISVMPTKELGVNPFDTFVFSNFYSKDILKVKAMTKGKIEAYAIKLSKQLLAPSNSKISKGGNGTYSVASPIRFAGKYYNKLEVSFEKGTVKEIITNFCNDCSGTEAYHYMEEYSKLIGVDIYTNKRTHLEEYVFVEKPGVLLWAKYKGSGLGKQLFGEYDYYNMFAMDKQVVRGLVNSKSEQKKIDDKVANWSKIIKDFEDKKRENNTSNKIKNQRLPKKGLTNKVLEVQAFVAAKNWASRYNWKETITKTYFTNTDWSIKRHAISGVITGRQINGVIVMKRSDGLCSFHYAVFAQQYDGTKYVSVYTLGITPGQIKLNCEHAN